MGEEWQESRPASRTATLHGAARYIEDLGGFRHGIALHVDENKGGALFRGEGAHGFDEFAAQILAFCWCLSGFMGLEELIQAFRIVDG